MREKYIKMLQAYYKQHKATPGKRDLSGYYNQIIRIFGSWNEALEAGNVPISRERSPSPEKMIASLQAYFKKYGVSPRANDCRKANGLYDTKFYFKILKKKSWADVLEAAGLQAYTRMSTDIKKGDDRLLKKIKKFIESNRIGSYLEYSKKKGSLPSATYLSEKYGSWNSFLKAADLPIIRFKYDFDVVEKAIKKLAGRRKIAPGLEELAKYVNIHPRAITAYFGAYNTFVQQLGYYTKNDTPETVVESKEQLLKLYKSFSKNNGYKSGAPSRALDAAADIYNSDVFLIRFGSMYNLRMESGYQPKREYPSLYTKEGISEALKRERKKAGRKPTNAEIDSSESLPAVSTILRCFKKTSMAAVWEEVLRKKS